MSHDKVSPDEQVVGIHESGIKLHEGTNTSKAGVKCPACKGKMHCFVTVDRETGEAEFHDTCTKNKPCECKCKTHYSCRECGYLHPYQNSCNRKESAVKNTKADRQIIDINTQWRKHQAEKQQNMPKIRKE